MKKCLIFVLLILPSYCYAEMNPYIFGAIIDSGGGEGTTKYVGFPANSETGVPDSPDAGWSNYGASSGDRFYGEYWEATEAGTVNAINLYHLLSLASYSDVFGCVYNGTTLIGMTADIGTDTGTEVWTGYITVVAEAGESLTFAATDIIRFGACFNDATTGAVWVIDNNGGNAVQYSSETWDSGTEPPNPITWTESSSAWDFGTILRYTD